MHQLKIANCDPQDVDCLSDLLELHGALSVTLTDQFDDPILEPEPGTVPLWPHVILQALYEPQVNIDAIIKMIISHYPYAECSVDALVEQDWERVCLTDFKPQRFGKRLWVCPSWHTPPQPKAINLILDPGLAFGTGSHATTSLCLTWLEQANVKNKTVIDYGCGSGILSIAALKLGAKYAYAVDIDPQALEATKNNAETNHLTAKNLTVDFPKQLKTPVDILIANILLAPLVTLKLSFYQLLSTKGQLVVSGILANQAQGLIEHYQSHFDFLTMEKEEDWVLIVFEKKTVVVEKYLN